jgi:hypothetical protein
VLPLPVLPVLPLPVLPVLPLPVLPLPVDPPLPFVPAMEGDDAELCGFRLALAPPHPARKTGTVSAINEQTNRFCIRFVASQIGRDVILQMRFSLRPPAMLELFLCRESFRGARPRPVAVWLDFSG